MSQNKDHFLVLDAARGLAALAVFLFHLKEFVFRDTNFGTTEFLSKSYLAVDLFFLMSGLVIARSYGDKLLSLSLSFSNFVKVRLLRLYPLYLAGLALGALYIIFKWIIKNEDPVIATDFARSLFLNGIFIPDFLNKESLFIFNPAAWSLSLEWIINLIYAALAVKMARRLLLSITILSGAVLIYLGIDAGTVDLGWSAKTFLGGIIRIIFSFTLGVLLYKNMPHLKTKILTSPYVLLALLSLCLILPIGSHTVYYDFICIFFIFPTFVCLACNSTTPKCLKKPFFMIGQTSYALYILHTPLVMWMGGAWKIVMKTEPQEQALPGFLFMSVGIVLMSFFAATLFDEPVRKIIKDKVFK